MPVAAVLLDLDGLIADTEPLHIEALRAAAASFGVTLPDDYVAAKLVGASDEQNAIDIAADFTPGVDPGALLARKEREFLVLASERPISPRPGLDDLLALLRARGVRLAVVSSSKADAVGVVLAALGRTRAGDWLAGCFDLVVAGSEVAAVKPAPELYLRACRALAVSPEDCLALEDSAAGVLAARAAGVRCIAAPNEVTRGQDFSAAWRVCGSLDEAASLIEPLLPPADARG
jgi:beta-phosphoglucomutase-like phosphatase (HAD superfamily)